MSSSRHTRPTEELYNWRSMMANVPSWYGTRTHSMEPTLRDAKYSTKRASISTSATDQLRHQHSAFKSAYGRTTFRSFRAGHFHLREVDGCCDGSLANSDESGEYVNNTGAVPRCELRDDSACAYPGMKCSGGLSSSVLGEQKFSSGRTYSLSRSTHSGFWRR